LTVSFSYERVIPKGNDKHIEFERDRLTNAVRRVALLSNERSRAVKFQVDTNRVDVMSSSSDGRAHGRCRSIQRQLDADGFNAHVLTFSRLFHLTSSLPT
jgi:hypothetical protein